MIDIVDQARNPDAGAFDAPAKYAAYLEGLCQELADEVERLQGEGTRYKARLQVLRAYLTSYSGPSTTLWRDFCRVRPEAREWFDEDGVPT